MEDVRKELTELRTIQVVVMCFLVIMLEGFDIQAAGVTMRKLATEFQLDKLQMGYLPAPAPSACCCSRRSAASSLIGSAASRS